MKRVIVAFVASAASAVSLGLPVANAATLCVGSGAGCFSGLAPALAAAHDGDTIKVGPGTFSGGITIDKSVHLQGAGAGATVISGGGPVVTIFRAVASDGLSVTIDGVTVTGGVNSTMPDGAVTFGGGIWIPTSQLPNPPFNGTGATVSISNSVITRNTVTSNQVIPPGFCGPRSCGFNSGGGIDNGGVLTLTNTRVTDNTAGSTGSMLSAASDATAGGIGSRFASTLVLQNTVVSGNRAVVNSPIANSADAGGIGSSGALTVVNSVVSANSTQYTGSVALGDQVALAGGLDVSECCDVSHPMVTIQNTQITGNQALATNTDADSVPTAFAGGIIAGTPLLLDHVSLSNNTVHAVGAGDAGADGGGMEVDAPVTVRDSLVSHNSALAEGKGGAIAFGGGLAMFGSDLTLERTVVVGNSATATGAGGPLPFGATSSALGGGISNGAFGLPPATLSLTDSVVVANSLSASTGFLVEGGGVYTEFGVSRTRTTIAGNKPDQCFGC